MRRWALAMAMLLAPAAVQATPLSVGVSLAPGSIATGQTITVNIQVTNSGSLTYYNVSTTVQVFSTGGGASATLVTTPSPSAVTLTASNSTNFLWVYQGSGCGNISFSAWATGDESGAVSTAGPVNSPLAPVVCTPTPSPTASPTFTPSPVVTATSTATQTPWIIYGTPTAIPAVGDASIPGNIYHPDQGQSLQLRYDAPLDASITIDLFNRLGQRVRHFERSVTAGRYTELWDGRNDQGLLVSAGIYVAQFKGKGLFKTVKFAVIK